ncbi:hypothetical protein COO60DRAFT_1024669 [Scenedesmus sp. NREL 46B-D3]|nr:hypothetical protein COO60DRAFT_1024669 [Scenedesmus sp. NREL 46B-D3]
MAARVRWHCRGCWVWCCSTARAVSASGGAATLRSALGVTGKGLDLSPAGDRGQEMCLMHHPCICIGCSAAAQHMLVVLLGAVGHLPTPHLPLSYLAICGTGRVTWLMSCSFPADMRWC